MRKLVLLLLAALAVLPLAQLKAGNDCSCGGAATITCSITVSGYEVRATGCNFRNSFGGVVQFFGDTADDQYGNWAIRYLPAEMMQDMDYYAVATFWHNYTVRGTWRPEGEVWTYLVWDRWESGSVAYSDGTVAVKVEYPQFGWTWETGRPSRVVLHTPPTSPQHGNTTIDWKGFANGPSKSFSSNTVVEGSGWIAGWLKYSVWRGKVRGAWYLLGQIVQPPPPKPDSVSVWARDDATGRAILNASVRVWWRGDYCVGMYCSNRTTPTGQRGCGFNLEAYSSGATWAAVDPGWQPECASPWLCGGTASQMLDKYGVYNVFSLYVGVNPMRTKALTGTFLVQVALQGSNANAVELQVEDPPGSGKYAVLERAEDTIFYRPYLSYKRVLTLNNQRLRIVVYSGPSYFGWPSASGWTVVAEPASGIAQPAGWEVYKGSDLILKTSSAETGWFGAYEGNSYTAIAVYSLQRKLTVKLVKPDGTPAYGAWIKVDGVEYSDCGDGVCDGIITVNVGAGPHTVEVLDTYYNKTVAERGLWSATSTTYNQRYHW
ncbi:MAG: hypothetical protein LM580_11530, partial [Thermofilum sp.]|nr:hypothetical protein [Thermofilum sp.]